MFTKKDFFEFFLLKNAIPLCDLVRPDTRDYYYQFQSKESKPFVKVYVRLLY